MKHFTINELTRSTTAAALGIDNTPDTAVIASLVSLVDNVLDPLRQAWRRPITVNSGYRSPALNRAVGGTPNSQHLRGEAADITAGSPAANRSLFLLALQLDLPFDQLIDERSYSWLHISYRQNPRKNILHL